MVLPIAGKGHPVMGNKKTKLARGEAPVMERLQSSFDKCIAGVAMNNAAMEEKYDARWAMTFEKQEVKIGLLKTNVLAIKRKEDLALLTTDTSLMCAEVKALDKTQCNLILAKMWSPPASSTSSNPMPAMDPPGAPTGKENEEGEDVFAI
jgi:hypothetical protein